MPFLFKNTNVLHIQSGTLQQQPIYLGHLDYHKNKTYNRAQIMKRKKTLKNVKMLLYIYEYIA